MSATFKLAKKKYTQNDLRRLMSEQKAKGTKPTATKVDSPLAKYNELGQLMCILCKSVVRSEDVWKVHINAKQHKQNIELAKQLKDKTNNFTKPTAPAGNKRSAAPIVSEIPSKVPKGILKNSTKPTNATSTVPNDAPAENSLPNDFFDNPKAGGYFAATLKKTSIRTDLVNIRRGNDSENNVGQNDDVTAMDVDQPIKDDAIPEGFFDDPIKDAKARNLDYKDPVEEEWDKFQQEIKEASSFSNAIIAEDQEEATSERQIDEIDEQMRNWSRVLELEKKKEIVNKSGKLREVRNIFAKKEKDNSDDESDSDEDNCKIGDIDEYLDWRAKKAYK